MSTKSLQSVKDIIVQLHGRCTQTLDRSLVDDFAALNGAIYSLLSDLDRWDIVLSDRPEQALYRTASSEFAFALLNNSQGQYRNAFKGLRLALELILQGVYLSANLVTLSEWLSSQADTSWAAIIDEHNGIFAARFCRAFFPDVASEVAPFRSLAGTLYREMSECTHGNVPNKIPLPDKIEFDKSTFELWHEKAGTLRYIANFALTTRYYFSLKREEKLKVSDTILDQLGNFEAIREKLAADT